ncbi:DinB superfamily protein [Rufibacter sp. DG15C]|uniref:DinB family protein n=1 Tax=Rufibacter sp. DG15C TaxID=1379909 RepID=UPI00078B9999|nr:DinB family protein [Rufibacter sp. DG15C]AMM52638.1 DinB superfamily protein [Rufibacter sp. DG15C]
MVNELTQIFSRDLDRLKGEIESFQEERNLWLTAGGIKNSSGNLCLHLVGNLKTYIGKSMGGFSYHRNRDAEFSLKHIPKQELLTQVEETKKWVVDTLQQLPDEKLQEPYPENVLGYEMTNAFFLIHLAGHLTYHLGQINYLRRILEE